MTWFLYSHRGSWLVERDGTVNETQRNRQNGGRVILMEIVVVSKNGDTLYCFICTVIIIVHVLKMLLLVYLTISFKK